MVPPGLEGDIKPSIQGGSATDWKTYNEIKYYTNVFIIQDGKVNHKLYASLISNY